MKFLLLEKKRVGKFLLVEEYDTLTEEKNIGPALWRGYTKTQDVKGDGTGKRLGIDDYSRPEEYTEEDGTKRRVSYLPGGSFKVETLGADGKWKVTRSALPGSMAMNIGRQGDMSVGSEDTENYSLIGRTQGRLKKKTLGVKDGIYHITDESLLAELRDMVYQNIDNLRNGGKFLKGRFMAHPNELYEKAIGDIMRWIMARLLPLTKFLREGNLEDGYSIQELLDTYSLLYTLFGPSFRETPIFRFDRDDIIKSLTKMLRNGTKIPAIQYSVLKSRLDKKNAEVVREIQNIEAKLESGVHPNAVEKLRNKLEVLRGGNKYVWDFNPYEIPNRLMTVNEFMESRYNIYSKSRSPMYPGKGIKGGGHLAGSYERHGEGTRNIRNRMSNKETPLEFFLKVSSDPYEMTKISVSPLFGSCQTTGMLSTGANKRELVHNLRESPNSKVVFLYADIPHHGGSDSNLSWTHSVIGRLILTLTAQGQIKAENIYVPESWNGGNNKLLKMVEDVVHIPGLSVIDEYDDFPSRSKGENMFYKDVRRNSNNEPNIITDTKLYRTLYRIIGETYPIGLSDYLSDEETVDDIIKNIAPEFKQTLDDNGMIIYRTENGSEKAMKAAKKLWPNVDKVSVKQLMEAIRIIYDKLGNHDVDDYRGYLNQDKRTIRLFTAKVRLAVSAHLIYYGFDNSPLLNLEFVDLYVLPALESSNAAYDWGDDEELDH